MLRGTLLICGSCGDCIEQSGEAPTREQIEAQREDFTCDCGGALELEAPETRVVISHLEFRGG